MGQVFARKTTDDRVYLCIDLKSFYASVECAERGLDPFTTNLVVADPDRTETTICLAITPAMKALGVKNRCRVYEIPPGIDYYMAVPRMRLYMRKSAEIYGIYLRFVAEADIYPYSIDECFIDATPYLRFYKVSPRDFAQRIITAVMEQTGIAATAGIGTNLFLAKVALDIDAKHSPDLIGQLDQRAFRERIWRHRPITDVWQVGPGIARRLARYGALDLHDVCEMDPETLYREFGRNAQYLIDHAWGVETATMADVKSYVPKATSMTNGQVLPCSYSAAEARIVLREMVEASCLEMGERGVLAGGVSVSVGYDRDAVGVLVAGCGSAAGGLAGDGCAGRGSGPAAGVTAAGYAGVPSTGGSRKLAKPTRLFSALWREISDLFDDTLLEGIGVRRLSIGFFDVIDGGSGVQESLFGDPSSHEKETALLEAMQDVQRRFGKNAVLHAASLTEKATLRERNQQVGGHRA